MIDARASLYLVQVVPICQIKAMRGIQVRTGEFLVSFVAECPTNMLPIVPGDDRDHFLNLLLC